MINQFLSESWAIGIHGFYLKQVTGKPAFVGEATIEVKITDARTNLMAGRYPHSIGLGSHALTAMGFPGYNAIMPESAKSVANYLQEQSINFSLHSFLIFPA